MNKAKRALALLVLITAILIGLGMVTKTGLAANINPNCDSECGQEQIAGQAHLQAGSAPIALSDAFTTTEDTPLIVPAPGVLENDSDPDGDVLTTTLAISPTFGEIALALDGSFVYTPTLNYRGNDSFTYIVSDGAFTDTTNVSLTVELAGMAASPRIGVAPLGVNFTNLSDDGSTTIWDYGDGITATITSTTHAHIYASSGTYTVTMTVLDTQGAHTLVSPSYIAAFASGSPNVYYVDALNGSNASGDGSQAAPWQTITYASNHMYGVGLELRVASGTYNQALGESFPITMKSGISVTGVGYPFATVSGISSQPVFLFPSTAIFDSTTALSGLKITGGNSAVRVDGFSNTAVTPVIHDNLITQNIYGIHINAAGGRLARPLVYNNHILDNNQHGLYLFADKGAAIAEPDVQDNLIINNGGSGVYCYAHGAGYPYNHDYGLCSPTLTRNIIASNASDGFTCHTAYCGGCSPELTGNTISGNNGWGWGRVHEFTYLQSTRPVFTNNMITENHSGGALFVNSVTVYSDKDAPTFINNTIAFNGPYGIQNGYPSIVNNIVWGHTSDLNAPVSAVSYSDVSQGPYAGQNHNMSIDPKFLDSAQGDFHIAWNSPLVDLGDSQAANLPQTDFDGDPRFLGAAVDIGADEVMASLTARQSYGQEYVPPGTSLTITLSITNTGTVVQHPVVTDTLPEHVSPAGLLTWALPALNPGEAWSHPVSMTVDLGYVGPFTNTLITTGEASSFSNSQVLWSVEPVSGLAVINDSPTPLGDTSVLTASLAGGSDASFQWDLGDGTASSGQVVTHTYPAQGIYTATVTATNPLGAVSSASRVTITDRLITGLQASNDGPTSWGDATTFAASLLDGTGVAFTWDFGDGSGAVGDLVTHTYAAQGNFTAIVTATNSIGQAEATTIVTVNDVPISGLLAANDGPTTLGQPTHLSASLAAGTNPVFVWNLGDGTTIEGSDVSHTYAALGIYTATITVSNSANTLSASSPVIIAVPEHRLFLPLVSCGTPSQSAILPASEDRIGLHDFTQVFR
jgi:PKD repeat protein